MIRSTLKQLGLFLSVMVGLAGLYLLAAWALPKVPVNADRTAARGDIPVYILSNGVHTDLVLPLTTAQHDWRTLLDPHHMAVPDTTARWVAFGWGDKGFYLDTPTWADLKASTAFKAMFGLSGSAMHITYHLELQEGPQCHRFLVSPEAYTRLVRFIEASFVRNAQGSPEPITGAHYTDTDVFYEARGRYNLFRTCNCWTNEGLKACGAKACLWSPFQQGLMDRYAPAQ